MHMKCDSVGRLFDWRVHGGAAQGPAQLGRPDQHAPGNDQEAAAPRRVDLRQQPIEIQSRLDCAARCLVTTARIPISRTSRPFKILAFFCNCLAKIKRKI